MPSKETKRERKELARRRKLEEMRAAERRRRLRKITSILTVVAAAAAIWGIFWLTGRSNRESLAAVNDLATAAGCSPVEEPEYKGKDHIEAPALGDYSSDPPASGSHYNAAGSPTTTGLHTEPVPNESQVHNLEHGHVGIQYTDALDPEIKTKLEEIADTEENDNWVFIAPRPDMPQPLAFTAWRKLVTCQTPTTPDAVGAFVTTFIEEFQQQAPEKFEG